MSTKTTKLLASSLSVALLATMVTIPASAAATKQLSGRDRYETALKIVQDGWDKSENAVIARGDVLADALAAAPLAYAKGKAPILLTKTNEISTDVLTELKSLGVKNVFIVGGVGAVSKTVADKLAKEGFNIKRLEGKNRVETSMAIAKESFAAIPAEVVIANGLSYADALSVSSVAAAKGMPILLVNKNVLTAEQKAYIAGKTVYAVGGTGVLNAAVVTEAKAERVSGVNRYETNAAILSKFKQDYSNVYLAKGTDANLVDALTGSALAAKNNNPVVLVNVNNAITTSVANVVEKNITFNSTVVRLGGTVTTAAVNTIEALKAEAGTTLKMSVADADSTLTADGADNTIITVQVIKDGAVNTTFNGTVKFQSLKGATFAKETVAFDKGVAKVQLTSMSSAVAITDTIRATINNADDINSVGIASELKIVYSPATASQNDKAFITYAEASQTGDIYVKFNKDIDFAKLYEEFKLDKNIITASTKTPVDLLKVDGSTIKLVLNENDAVSDNAKITIANIGTGIMVVGGVNFNLVDPKAPEAMSITNPDYRTISVKFTEPMSKETANVASNWVLNGSQLVAADFLNNVGPTVGVYKFDGQVDNRAFVELKLSADGVKKYKAAGKENILQAYGQTDYAAKTDFTGQNVATTQEFRFITPALPGAPTATVTMDSAEQYRVKFSAPIKTTLTKDAFKLNYLTNIVDGKNVWSAEDINNATVTNIGGTDNNEYLIELNSDWTEKLETATTGINYYAPKHNQVQITVNKASVTSALNVAMVADKVQALTMTLDATSPTISSAVQAVNAVTKAPLQQVNVAMSEPVQIPGSTMEITPSQKQTSGVPTPTFQFVNADGSKTVDGVLLDNKIDAQDKNFSVVPASALESGTWTLYVRSISDDIGNTSATTSQTVFIKTATVTTTPRIVWADAHDSVNGSDVIHIQFATEMSNDALTSTVYTINGKILPQGVKITSENVKDSVGTLVTITTPDTFIVGNGKNILNVLKSLKNAAGVNITGATEVELPYGVPVK